MSCGHPLCELIEGPCSIAVQRSRGCRPNLTSREVSPAVFDEVRALLPLVEHDKPSAIRLAAIIRREALDGRQLLAHARNDEPELVPALERLCTRRT